MIKRSVKISLIALLLGSTSVVALRNGHNVKQLFSTERAGKDSDEDEAREEKAEKQEIAGALEFYNSKQANLTTGQVDQAQAYAVYKQMTSKARAKTLGSWLQWTEMGPDNITGRCRGIVVDKDDNNTIYGSGVSGGFWVSHDGGGTWVRSGGVDQPNINISCIAQAADGTLYYGTGEAITMGGSGGNADGNSGFLGRGMYKSTDRGQTFTLLSATDPGANKYAPSVTPEWANISRIATDPKNANHLLASNSAGVKASTDGGQTWKTPTGLPANKVAYTVMFSPDGSTVLATFGTSLSNFISAMTLYRSTDGGNTFSQVKDTKIVGNTGSVAACSFELAFAPSNSSIVYASLASSTNYGQLLGVFRSQDGGASWASIATGDANFNPFAAQGYYDNCIGVDPINPDHIIFGGLNLWAGKKVGTAFSFSQLTNWSSKFLDLNNTYVNPYYVHADQHIITFDHNTTAPSLYIGSDGGIAKSVDFSTATQPTFFASNYGMGTIQFYGIGISATDRLEVIGGSQDNGTIRVKKGGITLLNADPIKGGDGGYSEISMINPDLYFGEYVYGDFARSFNKGQSWAEFNDNHLPPISNNANYNFVEIFRLWESMNDATSIDSATFIDQDSAHKAGTTINVMSRSGVDIPVKLTQFLPAGTELKVQDKIQSKFFLGTKGQGLWMTREAVISSVTPTFYKILDKKINTHDIEVTPDGNTVFVCGSEGSNGVIYQVSGLNGKVYKYNGNSFDPSAIGITYKQIFSVPNYPIIGMDVDVNDPNHVLATVGGYDSTISHVYVSKNAMSASPTFTSAGGSGIGKLPRFPVYDALINMHEPTQYLLATEFGIWASKNGGTTWTEENLGMERVPTFQLRQRTFSTKSWTGPVIYAATHGRGVFMTSTIETGVNETQETAKAAMNISLYPNPVSDYANVTVNLPSAAQVTITIYDMRGAVVGTYNYANQISGDHTYRMDASTLKGGTYFVRVNTGTEQQTGKMLIMK